MGLDAPATRYVKRCKTGFALVVTLSLMILLTVLALGLLSLSSIALRGSSQQEALASARANARVALMLALGELQRQTGPDTRVTARADVLEENNPPILGVWKSWEGQDHETSGTFAGRPKSPGSDYRAAKKARFTAWLNSASVDDPTRLPDSTAGAGKVTLVGAGAVGADVKRTDRQIHLTPTAIAHGRLPGNLAWWIGGENQKARLPKPYQADPADSAPRWAAHGKSHSTADPKPFRLDGLLEDPTLAANAITLQQADLIAARDASNKSSQDFFHDLSAVSTGLLTNTATGGWRKDLTLLTESWQSQPTSNLPLFRLTPDKNTSASRPSQGDPLAAGSMLYPWATYRGNISSGPIYQHGPVTSWANLVDYATLYKRITASSSGRLSTPIQSNPIFGNSYDFLHKVRILPVIARMQWVFSHSSVKSGAQYEPRLLLTPMLTLWNPYNVELTAPQLMEFVVRKPLPTALRYTIGTTPNTQYNCLMAGSSNYATLSGTGTLTYRISNEFTLKPGENRLFSPASLTPVDAGTAIELAVGFRSGTGHYFQIKDDSGSTPLLAGATDIKADAKFDTTYSDFASTGVATGVGIYLDMNINGSWHLAYRMVYTPEIANVIYQPLNGMTNANLTQCETNPVPFLSTIFGARMASRTHLAAKGFVQSSPLVNYTAMGKKDEEEATIKRHYGGTGHPVNSPFDYSFVMHSSAGTSDLPNANDTSGRGYIVTGFISGDGLSRCVIDELPTRPLSSLGELVNWDLRYENPIPPYAFNLIGNSDATPLLPAGAVVNSNDAGLTENLQYDDSYCANHLLFDDWFVSGIAADSSQFGAPLATATAKITFTNFLKGTSPLPNRCYQPLLKDQTKAKADAAAANQLYKDHVEPVAAYRSIASRIEVEGMFNVNSTSVTAWRALLGHARNQRVPFIRETGNAWDINLSAETDHAVTRFSVAGDGPAGGASTSGIFPEANDFTGFRTLDDPFLDALATEVVDQIRQRGPFLSLSEFINRQLSSGKLALAGTLQAALNEVTAKQATNLFASIQELSTPSLARPDAEYQFADAAVGFSGYGLPGWTRQADLLRPLAPILSARDDTFIIRGYGDARDSQGRILARSVCEAIVRRTREWMDPTEQADITRPPTKPLNQTFGRRYQIVSFRWLVANEI